MHIKYIAKLLLLPTTKQFRLQTWLAFKVLYLKTVEYILFKSFTSLQVNRWSGPQKKFNPFSFDKWLNCAFNVGRYNDNDGDGNDDDDDVGPT